MQLNYIWPTCIFPSNMLQTWSQSHIWPSLALYLACGNFRPGTVCAYMYIYGFDIFSDVMGTRNKWHIWIIHLAGFLQSIAFPKGSDILFDTLFLRPTASAYSSQEQTRLSTIDEGSPAITFSSSSLHSPTTTAIVSRSSISVSSPFFLPRLPLLHYKFHLPQG